MCITEFDEKKFVDSIREEGREEGRLEGLLETVKILEDMVTDGIITLEEAAQRAGMSTAEFTEYLRKIS